MWWQISLAMAAALIAVGLMLWTRRTNIAGEDDQRLPHAQKYETLGDEGRQSGTLTSSADVCRYAFRSSDRFAGSYTSGADETLLGTGGPLAYSLFTMPAGKTGRVLAFTGSQELQAELVSMGFNVGREVKILNNGVGGSGLLVAIGETRLAVGNSIAERIVVAVDPSDGFV